MDKKQPAMHFSDLHSFCSGVRGSWTDFFYFMRNTTLSFRRSEEIAICDIIEKFFVIQNQFSVCDKKLVLPEDIRHIEDDYTHLSEMIFDLEKTLERYNQQPRSANLCDEESREETPEGE